jgi:capsular polysaccharide biosynthesis protein
MPNNNQIDLQELFWVLLGNWRQLLMGLLIGAFLFGAYHTFYIKPVYRADASIFITDTSSVVTISDLQLSSTLTEDYAKIIKSRTVLKEVIEELGLNMTFGQLNNLVSVTNPSGSHIITITVTTSDMELSKNIANALIGVGVDRIYQVMGRGEPTVIDYSEMAAVTEIVASLRSYMEKGALLGIALVAALIVLRFLTDTTLKTEDDLKNYLNIPVLSVVPYFEEKKQ